jgi:hypothetical protein
MLIQMTVRLKACLSQRTAARVDPSCSAARAAACWPTEALQLRSYPERMECDCAECSRDSSLYSDDFRKSILSPDQAHRLLPVQGSRHSVRQVRDIQAHHDIRTQRSEADRRIRPRMPPPCAPSAPTRLSAMLPDDGIPNAAHMCSRFYALVCEPGFERQSDIFRQTVKVRPARNMPIPPGEAGRRRAR